MSPVPREINLHRLTVDEALARLDLYLNEAFLEGISPVRVNHGKGQGILRQAIHSQLKVHPLVKSFRIGEFGEGESGVTVVELVERGRLKGRQGIA